MKKDSKNLVVKIDEGVLLPHDLELEKDVLGSILIIGANAIMEVEQYLSPSTFYNPSNGAIYSAILSLSAAHKPIDTYNLAMELHGAGTLDSVGGSTYLVNLTRIVASTANLAQHAMILRQLEMQRGIFMLSEKAKAMSIDPSYDVQETIETVEKGLTELQINTRGKALSMVDCVSQFYSWVSDNAEHKNKAISTGLEGLDKILNGGFHAPDLIVLGGRPSMGKALRIDSHVLTPSGWKCMGDMHVGDEVVSIDGEKSYVTGVYPQGELETYKITFNDGRTTECCGDHLWEVYSTKFGRHGGETRVLNTKQIAEKLQSKRFHSRMSIPKFSGIYGEEKEFVIHPYILGILLGDGNLSGNGVVWTKPDLFIKNKIEKLLPQGYAITNIDEKSYRIINSKKGGRENILLSELRELGLIGTHSYNKFIPEKYKMCSREQRVQLLQGILDSDGWAEKTGAIQFSSSSRKLALDVQELCWSLGYVCSMRTREVYLNGERKRDAYVLCISADTPLECFSLPKKQERVCNRKRCRPCTIVSVEKTGRKVECQCISVSHERALYVTDQYIMTHNTQFAVHFARNAAEQHKHVYFVSIEMTAIQLTARMVAGDGISYSNMKKGTLCSQEWDALNESLAGLSMLSLNIADSPDCRQLSYIKSEARALKRKGELDLMVIDYLGLIRTNQHFEKRYIEVGYITGELKALAKELQIPIILLAQLSRPANGQEKQAPQMENLRESGDIEQDADIIIFPHRPYVYDDMACDEKGRSWKDRGVLLVPKNREGVRNARAYFMNDPQFKEFWDDEQANEQLKTS